MIKVINDKIYLTTVFHYIHIDVTNCNHYIRLYQVNINLLLQLLFICSYFYSSSVRFDKDIS